AGKRALPPQLIPASRRVRPWCFASRPCRGGRPLQCAVDFCFAARGELGEKGRCGYATGAGAPDIDVLAPSDRAHRVDGLLERGHIGFETEIAFGRGWVLPADGEGLQASVEAIPDDAFFRHEIEHVELVDLWRGDLKRPVGNIPGGWAGMGQLPYNRGAHDRPRGGGHILAHRGRARVGVRPQAPPAPDIPARSF